MKFFSLFLALLSTNAFADGKITNADIYSAAAIAMTKLAAKTANNVCTFDGSGFIGSGVAPSTSGNVLTSNGTTWASTALPADAGITQLTGDVTAGPGSGSQAATLATVNGNVGSFTYGNFTVNAKGLITAASSGTAPVTTIGTFGSTPNSGGASISSNTLTLQPADGTNPGGVSTTTQTFAGAKTFSTSVTTPLAVVSTSATTPLVLGGTTTTSPLSLQSTSGVGATGADIIFKVGNNGATEAARIINAGNVGIGTSAPGSKLDVTGAANFSTSATSPLGVFSTSTTTPIVIGGTGTTSTVTIQPTSGVGTTNADIIFKNGNNGGTEVARIINTGNVGIGTSAPGKLLDVNGTFNASGTVTLGSTLNVTGATTLTGNPILGSVEDSITAFAGGGQASATLLSATAIYHRVTVVASSGDSVKLPPATVGATHFIATVIAGNANLAVFPSTGETIFAGAANASILITRDSGMWFICITAGNWTSVGTRVVGTANQITANSATGGPTVTLSLPQSIDTAAAVTFASLAATTSVTTPLLIGGSGTTQSLIHKTTTGVGTTGADHIFQVGNNGATEAMRILNGGNVGIGTSAPAANLHIDNSGGSSLRLSRVASGAGYLQLDSDASAGYVSTGGAANPLLFRINNVEKMRVDASGNVGIGNTAPGSLLSIGKAGTTKGTMDLQGNTSGIVTIQPAAAAGTWSMTLPTTAGVSGQSLQTDGAGVTTWAASNGGQWVGSITWPTTTNCIWTRTSNATYGNQTQDADCDDNSPVAAGQAVLVNTGKDLAVELVITDNSYVYEFFWHGALASGTINGECMVRFSDGTNSSSGELLGAYFTPYGGGSGRITFGSTGTKDVYIQTTGSQANTECSFNANVGLRTMQIDVYRFPAAGSL